MENPSPRIELTEAEYIEIARRLDVLNAVAVAARTLNRELQDAYEARNSPHLKWHLKGGAIVSVFGISAQFFVVGPVLGYWALIGIVGFLWFISCTRDYDVAGLKCEFLALQENSLRVAWESVAGGVPYKDLGKYSDGAIEILDGEEFKALQHRVILEVVYRAFGYSRGLELDDKYSKDWTAIRKAKDNRSTKGQS